MILGNSEDFYRFGLVWHEDETDESKMYGNGELGQILCGWAWDRGVEHAEELRALEPNYTPVSEFAAGVLESIRGQW